MGIPNVASIGPSRTIVTSFTPKRPSLTGDVSLTEADDGDWVLCLASDPSMAGPSTLSCAVSNGEIQVYDQERLHVISSYPEITEAFVASDLVYRDQHAIVTAGNDGTLAVLDIRQSTPVHTARMPTDQVGLSLALGYSGSVLAVGSDKSCVQFYDLRSQFAQPMGVYKDAHNDEVTNVRFRDLSSDILTAGEDGLVCLFDTRQPTEETALKAVFNTGSPSRKVGFCGPDGGSVYCLTGNESLRIWNADSATVVKDYGISFRSSLTELSVGQLNVDYLIDARWDNFLQQLLLVAGNTKGNLGMFRLDNQTGMFAPPQILSGGHRGVVRAWTRLSDPAFLITAGEDARLCEWNLQRDTYMAPVHLPTPSCAKLVKRKRTGGSTPQRKQRFREEGDHEINSTI